MIDVETIETPSLGDRSYVAHDGEVAIVIDPQRDIDRVTAITASLGLRVALVAETHLHNDYVTGGYALAQASSAPYAVAASDSVSFERVPARDGSRFVAGSMSLTAVHTPGHTPTHLSYLLSEGSGDPAAVFTGGSMLFGAVGRTDLISRKDTEQLTHAQFRSVRHLARMLGDEVPVYPTHGFGSFCSASPASGETSTVGDQRARNVALVSDDEDRFVEDLIAGLGAYPRYYAHMAALNAAGPQAPELKAPAEVDPEELRRRIDADEWVVDLRQRRAFARSHVAGTVSMELDDSFATYAGWTIPWGDAVTLLGDKAEQVAEAQRQLCRIGMDRLAGRAVGSVDALSMGRLESYEVSDFEGLSKTLDGAGIVVLDVRAREEWSAGHVRGAVNIPVWELRDRLSEVPPGKVWVYCGAGYRSSIGASILARAGRDVVHVDDDWELAGGRGMPLS